MTACDLRNEGLTQLPVGIETLSCIRSGRSVSICQGLPWQVPNSQHVGTLFAHDAQPFQGRANFDRNIGHCRYGVPCVESR